MIAGVICFPVIRIALEHHALAGDVVFQAKRTEAGKLARRHRKTPRFGKSAVAIRGFEEMTRQDRNASEQPLGGRVGLREFKANGVVVQFRDGDRFSANDEQIALRRIDFFVEVNLKTEDDVVRVERLSVGEAQAAAKLQRVLLAVAGNAPGLCQRGFGLQRRAIDMNQIGGEAANDVTRWFVLSESGIQSLWLGA